MERTSSSSNATEVKPLFGRRFQTRQQHEQGKPHKRNAAEPDSVGTGIDNIVVDEEVEREYTDRMLHAIENVEAKDGYVAIPEDSWVRFKRFVSAAVFAKHSADARAAKLKKRLAQHQELETLEQQIAELQSHRVELMRELAIKEKRFADEFSLKAKLEQILEETDAWRENTLAMHRIIYAEKLMFDKLRRGIKFLDGFPIIKFDQIFKQGKSGLVEIAEAEDVDKLEARSDKASGKQDGILTGQILSG